MPRCAKSPRRHYGALLIVLYVSLAGVWAWRLRQPSAAGDVESPQRLAHLSTVATYLSKAPREVIQPILASLAMVSDSQLLKLREWSQKPEDQQLRELVVEERLSLGEGSVRDALLLAWLGHDANVSPVDAHLLIAAAGPLLDEDVKLYALETLAVRAQREGDAAGAITILQRACGMSQASWQTLLKLVGVCRSSRKPTTALRSITEWIDRHPADETTPWLESARDMEVSFMLETGRAAEAFSGQLDLLRAAPPGHLPERTLDRAQVCAHAANQSSRFLPWIEKHLAHFSESKLDWRGLLTRADVNPNYRRWLLLQTAIAEKELPASRALDFCLRLAACGERSAVVRVCALASPTNRVKECEIFLSAALDQPVLCISVLGAAQYYDIARRTLGEKLRQRPTDRDFHFSVALADAANKPGTTSAVTWQSFLRRFPGDLPAQRRLVQSLLHANQPAMALRVLGAIDPSKFSADDRKQEEILKQL